MLSAKWDVYHNDRSGSLVLSRMPLLRSMILCSHSPGPTRQANRDEERTTFHHYQCTHIELLTVHAVRKMDPPRSTRVNVKKHFIPKHTKKSRRRSPCSIRVNYKCAPEEINLQAQMTHFVCAENKRLITILVPKNPFSIKFSVNSNISSQQRVRRAPKRWRTSPLGCEPGLVQRRRRRVQAVCYQFDQMI